MHTLNKECQLFYSEFICELRFSFYSLIIQLFGIGYISLLSQLLSESQWEIKTKKEEWRTNVCVWKIAAFHALYHL